VNEVNPEGRSAAGIEDALARRVPPKAGAMLTGRVSEANYGPLAWGLLQLHRGLPQGGKCPVERCCNGKDLRQLQPYRQPPQKAPTAERGAGLRCTSVGYKQGLMPFCGI